MRDNRGNRKRVSNGEKMAEPADKGEAGGGGVPWLGRPPTSPPPCSGGLECGLDRAGETQPAAPPCSPRIPPPWPGCPFRLFNSIQLGLPARKLVSSDIQFN